jgi:mercuric ion transport protein
MTTSSLEKSESLLSKRRLSVAGIAAFIGCAACCAVPLLAAAGIGSGAVSALASVFRPGSELFVGATVFVVVLAVMAISNRLRRGPAASCGTSCAADGTCCDRNVRARSA